MGKSGKRQSVHMSPKAIASCLQHLPLMSFRKDAFVKYDNLNFKRAPSWSAMVPYVGTLGALLTETNGLCIKQIAMLNGIQEFAKDLDISEQNIEKASYSLCCMISQMANLKTRNRVVPRHWRQKFQSLFDKIQLPDPNEDDASDACPMALEDDEAEAIEILSSQEVDMNLFQSDDPELSALLAAGAPDAACEPHAPRPPPHKRIRPKRSDSSIPQPPAIDIGSFQVGELAGMMAAQESEDQLDPRAFATLNTNIKKQAKAKKQGKVKEGNGETSGKGKSAKSGKEQKSDEVGAKSSKLKLAHSKAYHQTLCRCLKAGMQRDEAKEQARTAAQHKVAELKALTT
jgi:hypothetical protein